MRPLFSAAWVSANRHITVVHRPASIAAAARATAPSGEQPPISTVWQKSTSSASWSAVVCDQKQLPAPGHRRRQNEAVDLAFLESGLVEEGFEDFGPELPHVPVAFLDDFRFGVADDRRVTQCHARAPATLLWSQRPSPDVPGAASGAARFSTNAVTRS